MATTKPIDSIHKQQDIKRQPLDGFKDLLYPILNWTNISQKNRANLIINNLAN